MKDYTKHLFIIFIAFVLHGLYVTFFTDFPFDKSIIPNCLCIYVLYEYEKLAVSTYKSVLDIKKLAEEYKKKEIEKRDNMIKLCETLQDAVKGLKQ